MALVDDAIAATELLTRDGTFSLGEVRQDEANFGNFVFVLTSKAGFCLRFVRDRGVRDEKGSLWLRLPDRRESDQRSQSHLAVR